MEKWNTLTASLRGYDVAVSETEDVLTVTDRANGNVIHVYDESAPAGEAPSERYKEYIVEFATQHRHFEDMEDAAEYARQLLNDEVLPLEFYRDGQPGFGGDIERDELPLLSQAWLAERFMVPAEQLAAYQFEIHSWSGKYDVAKTPVKELKR